jgi:hypothetical protein
MNLKSSFVQFLNEKYPAIEKNMLDSMISEQLLSTFHVTLSKNTFEQLQNEIRSYQNLRAWSQKNLTADYENKNLRKPNNTAVCTSYDFHINDQGQPKLIEINTNAAFLALGLELYSFHKHTPDTCFTENDLVQMFQNEIKLSGAVKNEIAIMDEKPQAQRLYIEFLIYQEIFKKNNLNTKILDITDIDSASANCLIYNRYTDFFLDEEKSLPLKKLFNESNIQLSPHPYEYFLLADKQRMYDWNLQTEVEKPQSLLKIYDLGLEDKDFIWSIRKTLFFKPKNSFGSKQAYKGANISRKTFDALYGSQFIAQDYVMPAEIEVVIENIPQKLKYDLRCYAYDGKLQLIIARLYQGQTTNLQTLGGGFTIVKVS